jgi:hypothetical protein
MIAAFVLVISLVLLLQFFVPYCRSLIAAYKQVDLSDDAREVTGIEDHIVNGDDFRRLLQLVWLCPEPGDDKFEITAVRGYYALLNFLRAMGRSLAPAVAAWAEREREGCAYFAAVALDRRIAHNRDLMAQQMNP